MVDKFYIPKQTMELDLLPNLKTQKETELHYIKLNNDRKTTSNIGLSIWWRMYFCETFVQGSTFGIVLDFCAKNPPHSRAENLYLQL
jgi:hypothetical protein